MTVLVTPVNAYGATLSIPADGEAVNSSSWLGPLQEVANRLEFIRQRVPGANPSTGLIELFPELESAGLLTITDWVLSSVGNLGGSPQYATLFQQAIAQSAPAKISLPLDKFLRTGMIIRAMSLDWCGKNGHVGNVFTTRPAVALWKFPRSIGVGYASFYTPGNLIAGTQIDTQSDTAANSAAYEVVHTISKTITPETVDLANFTYLMAINGEYGGNATAGAFCQRASISVSA